MKPSVRIEEIVQVMQIDDGLLPGERPLDLFVHAIIEYLDEQAEKGNLVYYDETNHDVDTLTQVKEL